MRLINGMRLTVGELLGGGGTDSNDKPLKFKQEENTSVPTYNAEGSDGQVYGFTLGDVRVQVVASGKPDIVEQRRRGYPLPKEDARKADEMIKKQEEEQQKKREQAGLVAPQPTLTPTVERPTEFKVGESPRA